MIAEGIHSCYLSSFIMLIFLVLPQETSMGRCRLDAFVLQCSLSPENTLPMRVWDELSGLPTSALQGMVRGHHLARPDVAEFDYIGHTVY